MKNSQTLSTSLPVSLSHLSFGPVGSLAEWSKALASRLATPPPHGPVRDAHNKQRLSSQLLLSLRDGNIHLLMSARHVQRYAAASASLVLIPRAIKPNGLLLCAVQDFVWSSQLA